MWRYPINAELMNKNAFVSLLAVSLLSCLILTVTSCNSDSYTPKPRGYFRITLPEKKYRELDSIYPYRFEYPVYALITPDPLALQEKNWINIEFPNFKGRVHLSYKSIERPMMLEQYIEDARTLAMKHIPKSSGIEQYPVEDPERKVYGLTYTIRGVGAASPYQFYVTDSLHHFVRGALYFDAVPNNDSLLPVINFVKQDIDHLIRTIRWK